MTTDVKTGYIVPMRIGKDVLYLTETSFDFRCTKCIFNGKTCPTYTCGEVVKPLCEVLEYDCFSFMEMHPNL